MRALPPIAGLPLLCALPLGAAFAGVDATAPAEPDEAVRRSVESALDPRADPCDDFYRFACGGWLDATSLAAGEARRSRGLSARVAANRDALRSLVEEALADPGPEGGSRRRLATFHAACLDEATIEARGAAPLAPWLDAIGGVGDLADAFEVAARLHRLGAAPFFDLVSVGGTDAPRTESVAIAPGGLGLPSPDFYLAPGAEPGAVRDAYRDHVATMLALAGADRREARRDARAVVALERELARLAPLADDPAEEPLTTAEPGSGGGALPWRRFFTAAGRDAAAGSARIAPRFEGELARRLAATPPAALRAYLRWSAVHAAAPLLSPPFVAEDFAFYGRRLAGVSEPPSRDARCLALTVRSLPAEIAPLYLEGALPDAERAAATATIAAVGDALAERLPDLPWIDPATAGRAASRLHAVSYQVGGADRGIEERSIRLDPDGFFENVVSARSADFDRRIGRVGRPFNPADSLVAPFGVAAHWDPLNRALVVPAGLLGSPYFELAYPAPMRFGALGALAGHELVHAVDDLPASLAEPAVAARYEAATACVDAGLSRFEVAPGVRVDGRRTLREGVADAAGVAAAFDAYRKAAGRAAAERRAVPALSDEQLFFVAWAQTWCTLATPEYLRLQARLDTHPPARVRAVAAILNSRDFRRAFQCEAGDRMVRDPVCTVW